MVRYSVLAVVDTALRDYLNGCRTSSLLKVLIAGLHTAVQIFRKFMASRTAKNLFVVQYPNNI